VTDTPPYLHEMLTSQGNLYALLGSLAAAALLSIPFGFTVGAIPLIAFAAGEVIAAMYVPGSVSFRIKVDGRRRQAARAASRAELIEEIRRRAARRGHGGRFEKTMAIYARMIEYVDSLYPLAARGGTQLSVRDVEKLDNASLEYLCVQLALLMIEARAALINLDDMQQRIDAIDRELASPRAGTDTDALHKARADYLALAGRHRRMSSHKAALEATFSSMPAQMEDIYQSIVENPASQTLGARLDEAFDSLRLDEAIGKELAEDLSEELPNLAGLIGEAFGAGAGAAQSEG
jgi:hypothetical protein